ncbi:MAG: histidine kinase [Altibacter sp.]|uniref:sensor histidine kinase n=1 Tax=Altibacter sp. TaxID=2024823 RepID=UPI001E1A4D5F|nr:ATP-binding protein [Altibacter sp.]MBZ0328104.1 histidine kinase [Altibacter sp.]
MDEKEVQSFLVIFSIIAFCLALTVILLFALFQKRKNKLILEQQEAESRFKEEIIETQIEIKEDTLRNVSWELHDNIGQLLTLAKIQLQNAKGNPEVIEEAITTIGTSLNELRNLSKLINPSALSNLTLVEALQQEVERFNRLKYLNASIDYTDASFSIDNKKEIIIFRMLQEFFTNTVKHSKASKLIVDVAYNNKVLYINAQDDGVGFDTEKVSSKKGIGLTNIISRAKLIGADVKITSRPGEGTQLSLAYKID